MEHIPQEVALWMDKAYARNIAKNANIVMIAHKKTTKGSSYRCLKG
jgi:hypothetical protein